MYQRRLISMADTPDHSKLNISIPKLNFPEMSRFVDQLKMPTLPPIRNVVVENIEANYASEFYDRLQKRITDFDASLDDKHEVGVRLVNFGQTVMFHLESLGYWNPSLISFSGITDNGDPVELIQHVSQISVLLMKMPRRDPERPKCPIGFCATNMDGQPEQPS
jgi:hypothetical protein